MVTLAANVEQVNVIALTEDNAAPAPALSITLQIIIVPVCHGPASVADSQTACKVSNANSVLFDGLDAGLQFQQTCVVCKQHINKVVYGLECIDHDSISCVQCKIRNMLLVEAS